MARARSGGYLVKLSALSSSPQERTAGCSFPFLRGFWRNESLFFSSAAGRGETRGGLAAGSDRFH